MERKIAWVVMLVIVGLVLISSLSQDRETVLAQTEIEVDVEAERNHIHPNHVHPRGCTYGELCDEENEVEMLHFRSLWGLECREHEYPREVKGIASWYGGEEPLNDDTASGEIFDPKAMTAAHLCLPFGSTIRVTRISTGNSVLVRINDRGPNERLSDRIIDLTKGAMFALGGEEALNQGLVDVVIQVIELGPECEVCEEEK